MFLAAVYFIYYPFFQALICNPITHHLKETENGVKKEKLEGLLEYRL